MTDTDLLDSQIQDVLTRENLAYSLPGAWANYCSQGAWKYYKHHEIMEDGLMKIFNRQIRFLIVNCPAQVGKSDLCSKAFPSWYAGRRPNERLGLVSYEADFAESWGRKSLDWLETYGPSIFNVTINPDKRSGKHWETLNIKSKTSAGGGMKTAGIGGQITGNAYEGFIIEDPVKNPKEAQSKTKVKEIIDFMQGAVWPRIRPNTWVILVMTRWGTDDLTAWVIQQLNKINEPYEHIVIPGIADLEDDPLGRSIGDPLWPEERSLKFWEDQKQIMGTYWFASIIQQRPTKKGGNIIKTSWFRRFTERPARTEAEMIVLSVDAAQKAEEIHDYTVIGIWYVVEGTKYYLIDMIRDRFEHPDLLNIVMDLGDLWKPHLILVENKGAGTSLLQHLDKETSYGTLAIDPRSDKEMRMITESAVIKSGHVYIPLEGTQPWVFDFEQEMAAFPAATYDDIVDMVSQFLFWAREKRVTIELW
jgi:predicted phage terminase large subunit-like protein